MKVVIATLALVPALLGVSTIQTCYSPVKAAVLTAEEKCLAVMVYGEARGEPTHGQIAVAYTALNRTKTRGKTLCQVVLAPKQYSIFNNNPALRTAALSKHIQPIQKNSIDRASWDNAVAVAQTVSRKMVKDPSKGATYYVAFKSLRRVPNWVAQYNMTAAIGNHTFFDNAGDRVKLNKQV